MEIDFLFKIDFNINIKVLDILNELDYNTNNSKKLLNAYNNKSNDFSFTDESSMMEEMGYKISIVKGSQNNFKITTHDDWNRAEVLLKWQ